MGGFTNINSWGGISGMVADNQLFLAGVFLSDSGQPAVAPERQDFSSNGLTENFAAVAPSIGTTFFIGDGLASSGATQQFTVPAGATHLYLGFLDAWAFGGDPGFYGDNVGSLSATVNLGNPGSSSWSTLTMDRQVVAALVGTSATLQMALFTDTDLFASASDYAASINWGDGTSSTGQVQPSSRCPPRPVPPAPPQALFLPCFAVSGSHNYKWAPSTVFTPTVRVTKVAGAKAFDGSIQDIAEVQSRNGSLCLYYKRCGAHLKGQPAAIGVIAPLNLPDDKWSSSPTGMGWACTATAILGTNVVVTAHHCLDDTRGEPWPLTLPDGTTPVVLQFAPGHSGKCDPTHEFDLATCARPGIANPIPNPYGVYTTTTASAVEVGNTDVELVKFGPNARGKLLSNQRGLGLPPLFSFPDELGANAQHSWSGYGFASRTDNWTLQACSASPVDVLRSGDVAGDFRSLGCQLEGGGISGSPWITDAVVPQEVGAVHFGRCTCGGEFSTPLGPDVMEAFASMVAGPPSSPGP